MVYFPSLTRVTPLTTIQRERILPVPGEVVVQTGAHVEPLTIVARAQVPGPYHILNVAQALNVPPETANKYIRLRPGQPVKANQVVAQRTKFGLIPQAVRAPQAGVVAAVGGGRVLLEASGESVEIRAYLPGQVSNVMPKMGVLVETVGALIQSVWGSGGEAFGVLKVVVEQPVQSLRARYIDVACHGAVLVGGLLIEAAALRQALELQVQGIVVGSIHPTLIETAYQMPYPIVATEGLGEIPMASPIFHLLHTNAGREAAIGGRMQPRWGAIRPEVIIPLPAKRASPPPPADEPLAVGVQVRVIRGPAIGKVGTVLHLPTHPQALKTGDKVWGAYVAFEDTDLADKEQFVPFFNLELLG